MGQRRALVASANEYLSSQSSDTLTKVSSGAIISGTTTVDQLSIVFDPTMLLESNTTYSGVFTLIDLAGNQMTSTVQFTTGTSTF